MKKSKFTASNGIELTNLGGTWDRTKILFTGDSHPSNPNKSREANFDDEDFLALREFFQHERDQELGRWRDPVEKDATVYGMGSYLGSRRIRISNESNGASEEVLERALDRGVSEWSKGIAERYFAAHPIKKPWHTPKHLEIWVLTIRGCYSSEAYIYREGFAGLAPGFRPVNHEGRVTFHPESEYIIGGRRIWPEGDE